MASQSTPSTNSAPKELTINDLPLLCNTLNPVASKCFALGLQLGVKEARIQTIIANNRNDCEDQLREIISERLKQDKRLTWCDIVTALRSPSVNHPGLVRHIESWYISPSVDLSHDPSSDPQQHLSLGGERPYPMVMMGQTTVNRIENPNMGMTSVPISSLWGAPFFNQMGTTYWENYQPPTQMMSQIPVKGAPHWENYQPPTQMMGQIPVRGPPHWEPPTQMMGQIPVRGPPHWENYQPPTQMMCQTLVRGPPHGDNYQPPTKIMGQTSVRGPPHGENYQSLTQMMGQTPVRGALFPHPIPHYQTPYPNPPHNLAPIALQERVVGGQWGSQSYMSHGQSQMSHTHSQTCSSIESCPPPRRKSYLQYPELPPTQSSSASHPVRSAHHRSPMDTFVHYIKVTYKQCEIEKNLNVLKWPPTPSKIFINLACIDWESVVSKEEADEYTRAMVEDGNVDVIMKKKTNIDFDDIVRDLPPITASEKVVLVEGAPGVGKSTFAWEFCRRWERGEIAQQYQLVLLLRLRDERMSRAKSLRDLIYHSSENVCQAVVEELESTFGINTLIILEGFDELPDSQRKYFSIYLQLILGQLLLHATIMITSRPWATGALLVQFRHRVFLHVEILGFTEENITKYVTSVFTGEGKKTAGAIDQSVGGPDEVSEEAKKNIDDVMAYIGKYPQIKACMYIPLNAAIVVSVHQESKNGKCILPTTLTKLYQALTQILLLRYLRGHTEYSHQKWSVESFEDLPGEVYSQLLVISKIAYDGVCREGGKNVQLIFPDIPDDFETLGLMQSVSQLFMHGQKTSHNFLHLTFQEFLAAFLVSTMSPAEQLEHFQRHEDGRFRVVLRFLAGLSKLNKITPDELRSLLGEPKVEQSDEHQTPYCNPMRPDVCVSAHHTNWLFEAQNSELLQSLFHNHTASFTFTREMLPLEYYSVGYCIAQSHSKWSLTFDEDTEEEKLHMLVSGAKTGDGDYRVAVKTTSMTSEKINILVTGFSSNVEELYYLQIPDNGNSLSLPPLSTLHILELQVGNNESVFNISCDLSFSSLEALIISSSRKGTTLGIKTCKAIRKLLSSTTSLKEFHLCGNIRSRGYSPHVSKNGMEVITKGLSDNIALPLKSLDIDCVCTFTTTAIQHVLNVIAKSNGLQQLKIVSVKGLSDDINLSLKSLDINCKCTFTTTATRSLVQFITRTTTLQYIRICHVIFSAQGLIELTEAIHHCSRLQEKKLEELIIEKLLFCVECSEDVVNLKHMFNEYPDMRKLIDWKETAKISRSHKYTKEINTSTLYLALESSYVTVLDFSDISINDAESDNLAQALHHNTTLERLYLSNNNISDAGAVALAQALHHNSTLDSLDLSKNNISDGGAVALAQALHLNSTLKRLYLSNNNISDGGAVALAQALHHNSTLELLFLPCNDAIGKEGTHQLVQALTVNTSITKATLYGDAGGLILPSRCEEYATQCTQYNTVKDRIQFPEQTTLLYMDMITLMIRLDIILHPILGTSLT